MARVLTIITRISVSLSYSIIYFRSIPARETLISIDEAIINLITKYTRVASVCSASQPGVATFLHHRPEKRSPKPSAH
jgi:hypothetical protein